MAINKVQYGSTTLIDLSTDTVASSADILLGKVGHLRDGTVVTGTASGGDQHGTIWQDGQGNVHLDDESGIALQSKTATPTESSQVIEADEGYYALDKVTVGAISSSYVGTGVTRRSSSDLTVSGATVTVPSGYYASQASKAVASGTAGTPTATKSAVSNHAVTVTPSVTNTTGYITGGTKSGTAVSVSASELVSGSLNITSNGTHNVTNYASAVVNVSGGTSTEFLVTFTKDQNDIWQPDCTFAEAASAVSDGKTIVATAGDYTAVDITWDDGEEIFIVMVDESFSDTPAYPAYNYGVIVNTYVWSADGYEVDAVDQYYDIQAANATPADVTNGKIFLNASGYQVGTNSGGGGGGTSLEYEEGVWIPSSDVARGEIAFSNTHTTAPSVVFISDDYSVNGSVDTGNSNLTFCFINYKKVLNYNGFPWYQSVATYKECEIFISYQSTVTSSSSIAGYGNILDQNGSTEQYSSYYVTNQAFYPYGRSNSRYWRSGRTYKWKAIWL